MEPSLAELHAAHLATVQARAAVALATAGYDGLVVASGGLQMVYLDDMPYPFRANPQYRLWVPDASPDCFLEFRPGRRPRLWFHQPADYWHLPPAAPSGYWTAGFDIEVVADPPRLRDRLDGTLRWAVLGEPSPATAGLGDHDPPALVAALDYARGCKTPYEVECMKRASRIAVRAHDAAAACWRAGGSEFEAHLAYCAAAGQRDQDLPYNNIIGYGRHAAVLHYQVLDRERPARPTSFLIDAGASHAGYASDITRTYAPGPGAFADLLAALDGAQQALVGRVRPGTDYRDIHREAHARIGELLAVAGLARCSGPDAVESGVTRTFFPHGIGHLLGLQVHDVAGFAAGPDGGTRPRPDGHPYLRLTRDLEDGMVVTIEPGIYFIDLLLAEAAGDRRRALIDWDAVEALKPCGGIRIEDNVVAQADGPRNLTREAWAAADG